MANAEAKKDGALLGCLVLVALIIWGIVSGARQGWNVAKESGYVYHTERVMTDISPQWLEGEQKSCLYLNINGNEVAGLSCGSAGDLRNIPVRFYGETNGGDVNKNVQMEWKCTRNGERFDCTDGKELKAP